MASFYGNCHIENIVAGEAITAPAWVYVSTADGKMYKASASSTTNPAVGLVFADVASGDTGQAVFSGVIEWDFLTPISAARVYYLSSSTEGAQTTTAPTNKQHLGYATSSTRLIINPQPFAEAGGGGGGGGGVASVTGPGVDNTDPANPEISARPYAVYTALLSQFDTDAPVATILENTLGFTPTLTYIATGAFGLEYTGGFPADKTFIISPKPILREIDGLVNISRTSDDYISINSWFYEFIDPPSASNDILSNYPVEIRIYP